MKTPLALSNLWHQPARTLVSAGGVTFALLLVFAQLGFQGAVSFTATNTLNNLQFDLMIRSVHYAHLFEPDRVHRKWLVEAQNVPGVERAMPFWVTLQNWQRVVPGRPPELAAPIRPIAIMAFEPDQPVFSNQDIAAEVRAGNLSHENQLLIDNLTHAEYEPEDGKKFGRADVASEAEVAGHRFTLSGVYRLGTGLAANGSAIINDRGFAKMYPWNTQTNTSFGLVCVGDLQDVGQIQQALRRRFQLCDFDIQDQPSGAVSVLTREETLQAERHRWLWQTPIGLIFQLGVVLSLIVGSAIVYMVLATDVAEKLPEYATLLAMGYSRIYLASIVMTQAILLAVLGFLCSWGLAEMLYRVATAFSGIAMTMQTSRVISVFLLGVFMCSFSGVLSLRKLWKAEPANLF
jgi:putative ABC transport system permease protein